MRYGLGLDDGDLSQIRSDDVGLARRTSMCAETWRENAAVSDCLIPPPRLGYARDRDWHERDRRLLLVQRRAHA